MSVERTCEPAIARVLLLFLLAPLAKAYPTTSLPDASSTTPMHVTGDPLEDMCESIRPLSFPDGVTAEPLTRGPCGEGEWVVHQGPHLRCARRPCPEGQVPVEGRCLSDERASAALCPHGAGELLLSPSGRPLCVAVPLWARGRPLTAVCDALIAPPTTAIAVARIKCAQSDDGDCEKHVRRLPAGGPVIQPED